MTTTTQGQSPTDTNTASGAADLTDTVCKALRRAWQLGQTYWQQADSESFIQHKKSETTHAAFVALLDDTRAALASAPAQPAGMTDDEKHLRRMLCVAHAGASAYMDDGEASDSRMHPTIDFLRDSPKDIQRKIWERNRAALAAAPAQPVAEPDAAYAELPRVGAIGYASVVDIQSYAKTLTIGPHLVGVRDVALWTTDQLRDFADRTHALRTTSSRQAPAGAAPEPIAYLHDDGYWTPAKTDEGRKLNDRLQFAGSPKIGVHLAVPTAHAKPAQPASPCAICGSDEPFTGTCGSADPRALCKQPIITAQADSGVLEDAAQVEIDLFNDLNRTCGNTLTAQAKNLCRLGYRKVAPAARAQQKAGE